MGEPRVQDVRDGADKIVEVRDMHKSYRTGFRRKVVQAVRGISFDVMRGEVFGFLGPNGAGKTSTIRVLMGLVSATEGSALLFGQPAGSRAAASRLGFLPEAPYFYEYLTVHEFLDLAGRLFGMDRAARRSRADELIEVVGLTHAADKRLKSYSKGMLQRAGIAQALMSDPELVVFDEPMSGLDPVGRKEVRDIILGLRDDGKTVFFSSHILADVEVLCDRVAIMHRGTLRHVGTLADLVKDAASPVELVLRTAERLPEVLVSKFGEVRFRGDVTTAVLAANVDLNSVLAECIAANVPVVSITPQHDALEDLFLSLNAEDPP